MLSKRLVRQALVGFGILLAGVAGAQASVTIDFGTGDLALLESAYQEDGYSIAGSRIFLSGTFGKPVRSIALDSSATSLTITNDAGIPFSLLSLDHVCASCSVGSFSVSGTTSNGSTGPVTVSSSGSFATATAFAGFTGLSRLVLTYISGGNMRLDNIVLDVVPLPAALPLLASGLGVLMWVRRRRQPV